MSSSIADFRESYFAIRGDNEYAFRVDAADEGCEWRTFTGPNLRGGGWNSDARMAADGWDVTGGYRIAAALNAAQPAPALTPREHLDAAYEAAAEPEDGQVRTGESTILRYPDGTYSVSGPWPFAPAASGYRLLDARPSRPEHAEALDARIDAATRGVTDAPLTAAQVKALADALAADGVRVA